MDKLKKIIKEEIKKYLKEIKVNDPINNPTYLFKKIVKDFRQTNKNLTPDLIQAYQNKEFTDKLLNKILDEYHKFYKNNPKVSEYSNNYEGFKEWIQGIKYEDLPMSSSGSFATALIDEDWLYNLGLGLGLDEDEVDEIIDDE